MTPFFVLIRSADGSPYVLSEGCLHAVLAWDTVGEARRFAEAVGLTGFVPGQPDPDDLNEYMHQEGVHAYLWLHERHYCRVFQADINRCRAKLPAPRPSGRPIPAGLLAELDRMVEGGVR